MAAPRTPSRSLRRRARLARRWLIRARLDLGDRLRGTRDPLLPPRRKNLPSQIASVGERAVALMSERAGLEPGSAVLDIGCGPGRTAAALTRVLEPGAGRYEGFDVMPQSIRWCRKAISRRHPGFGFRLADLHNAQYNPGGRQRAAEFTFPYADGEFDVAFAGSVFTHLRPFESARYLAEAARVLRPGGRLLATWFLLDPEAEQLIASGTVARPGLFGAELPPLRLDNRFTDEDGHAFRSPHADTPEHMIVVDRELALALHERAGLDLVEVLAGSWAGREPGSGNLGQDVILAERPAHGG